MPGKHDWNSWDHYRHIHERRLQDFEHFLLRNDLDWTIAETVILCEGSLFCAGNVKIDIEKVLELEFRNGRPFVRTVRYKYHAYLLGDPPRNLLRYDNAHPHPGHADSHHRHLYGEDGSEAAVEWVGASGWPTLGEFIEQVVDMTAM